MSESLSPAAKAVLNACNPAPPGHSVYELPPDCGIRALVAALLVTIATELKTTNV